VGRVTVFLLAFSLLGLGFWRSVGAGGPLRPLARSLVGRWRDARAERARGDDAARALRTQTQAVIRIDPTADRHPISPWIYGVAHASGTEPLQDLGVALHRWGGNGNSRHNWVMNAWNSARDWRFQNGGAQKPPLVGAGAGVDGFIARSRTAGAEAYITIPAIGWVARDTDQGRRSLDVPEEGGPSLNAAGAIAGYDPAENRRRTSVVSRARKGKPFLFQPPQVPGATVYQDEFVHHLVQRFGSAEQGGVRFYAIDNEPDLWAQTHTDIHPARMGYDDVLATFLEYARAIKDVDPSAQVAGPVAWGWTGYLYSALDAGGDRFATHADRRAHADTPFLLWFLQAAAAADRKEGRRTLDILDVHYYPQSEGVYSERADDATRALRLRSVRSLADPSYTDESWIGEPIRLIPRLKEWIAQGYPGTKLGIMEWNFGGEGDICGALAIVEALGTFGREGVDLASYWTCPPPKSPGAQAFRLVRRAGGGFGDISCRATSDDPAHLPAFAAVDSRTGDITLLLVNKQPVPLRSVRIDVSGEGGVRSGRAWVLGAAAPTAVQPMAVSAPTGGQITLALPAYAAVLVRFSQGVKEKSND
jgi:hypothetical protein